jgi:hypothetical protein
MWILVSTVAGRKHRIQVEPNMTIGGIMEQLHQMEGIPEQQQRILFRGVNLGSERTLEDSRIEDGAVLHMVLSLRA